MEHTNYIPQRGEQVLVAQDVNNFSDTRIRVFSHIKDDMFYCFGDSSSLTEPLKPGVTRWYYCKRLKGEFHIDFKPTNVLLNFNKY